MRFVLVTVACAACSGTVTPTVTPVAIAEENSLTGDPSWNIDVAGGDDTLAVYARPLSVTQLEQVSFQVNVFQSEPISWKIFRLGWYGGAGARKVAEGGPVMAQPQPQPFIDATTGMVECRWSSTFGVQIAADWPSGVYLARIEAPDQGARWAYFIVHDERRADVILVMPTATDESYNDWGGESLYTDSRFGFPVGHAYEVSYDRPFSVGLGGGYLLTDALPAARYLEANGYDVSYLADHDVGRGNLSRAKLVMALAHDEYWTRAMRDQYEAARTAGVNLAYLGANTGYWQIRLDAANDGMPERRQIGYKEAASLDPQYGGPETTASFQILGRPENSLLGIMSVDWHVVDFPWVVKDASSWIYGGMGVQSGDLFAGVVGIESDGEVDNGRAPNNLDVVADSPDIGGEVLGLDHQQATVYETDKGFVFAAGSIRFAATLAGDRAQIGSQRIVRNLIAHAGGMPVGPENSVGAANGMGMPDLSRAASQVSTLAGTGQAGFADGPALSAQFKSPMGIAVAPDGAVIVADAGNHKLRRIAAGTVTTVLDGLGAPWGVAVAADGSIWTADPLNKQVLHDGQPVAGDFGTPAGIAVGADGRVWVTDLGGGAVYVIDGGAVKVAYPAGGELHFPSGIWVGDRVVVLDSGNRLVRILNADGTLGELAGNQAGGFLDGDGANARISPLLGIAQLGGDLLIADAGNYRLRIVEPGADLSSTRVRTFAGAPRLSNADGPGAQAGLVAPTGIAVAGGVVYIADTGNSLIRVARP